MGVYQKPGDKEINDREDAKRRVEQLRPSCQKWLARARRLFKDLPPGTRIYWQENQMCLMATAEDGRHYITDTGGEDGFALIDDIVVPGSDCGGW